MIIRGIWDDMFTFFLLERLNNRKVFLRKTLSSYLNMGIFIFPNVKHRTCMYGVLRVDFDMSLINRLGEELRYLAWVLKEDYEKPIR